MHALQLPPRHLWRVTLLAAPLALAFMALLAAPIGPGASDSGSVRQAGPARPALTTAPPARTTTAVRPLLAPRPSWLANPLAPPTFTLPSAR
jgi:hypothetical protein